MSDLIKRLEESNEKERHHLILQLLDKDRLPVSNDFRTKLGRQINCDIPENGCYVAIDYQLNWLEKCLNEVKSSTIVVEETVQDFDLMIAFSMSRKDYLVFIEAKGPSGSWDNNQMKSKAERLEKIFGVSGKDIPSVEPRFCLISPSKPENLLTNAWPSWMTKEGETGQDRYYWIPLSLLNK